MGEIVESADRKDIAKRIVGKCGGLPLAIRAIANTLKDKTLSHWEVCISKLKGQNLESVVGEALKFSYDYLSKPYAKEMFLLCCLFPEDQLIYIEDLFKLGLGFGLFQNTTTLDTAMAQADVLVDYLKSSSLLLESQTEKCVQMHDVIREFAISVASRDKHVFLVGTRQEFICWKRNHDFTRCTAI